MKVPVAHHRIAARPRSADVPSPVADGRGHPALRVSLFGVARASGEMADAHGSGPCVRKDVGVQLPPYPLWLRQTMKGPGRGDADRGPLSWTVGGLFLGCRPPASVGTTALVIADLRARLALPSG